MKGVDKVQIQFKMIVKWSISHCTIADYISFCSLFLKMANWAAKITFLWLNLVTIALLWV